MHKIKSLFFVFESEKHEINQTNPRKRRSHDTLSGLFFIMVAYFCYCSETLNEAASLLRHNCLSFDTYRIPKVSILEYRVVRGTPRSLAAFATLPPVRTNISLMSLFS